MKYEFYSWLRLTFYSISREKEKLKQVLQTLLDISLDQMDSLLERNKNIDNFQILEYSQNE